jgi:hypothetical protein
MKNRNIAIVIAALCMLMMGACFSPWEGSGEGTIVINLGDGGARLAAGDEYGYTIILTNSGETAIPPEPITGLQYRRTVQPGTWNILVCRADSTTGKLNGYGETDVEVIPGLTVNKTITVRATDATKVVNTWDELKSVFEKNTNENEVVIITRDLSAHISMNLPSQTWNITLRAEKNVTITKSYTDSVGNSLFRVLSGCTLSLGAEDMKGIITINGGGNKKGNSSLAYVEGTLNMNDKVTLTNNYTTISSPQRGGAVSVYGGTFNMNGGIISSNSTVNNGGGVYVSSGNFYKRGGTIYGSGEGSKSNKATQGQAVYGPDTRAIDKTLGPKDNL